MINFNTEKSTEMRRKKYTSKFKTKVVLEALRERMTNTELAQKHELHPQQISNWKREFLNKAETVFEKKSSAKSEADQEKERLLQVIGQQKVEIDFLARTLR